MYFLCKHGPRNYITSICHQINIHECSLNDRVLTNINICFSPTREVIHEIHENLHLMKKIQCNILHSIPYHGAIILS